MIVKYELTNKLDLVGIHTFLQWLPVITPPVSPASEVTQIWAEKTPNVGPNFVISRAGLAAPLTRRWEWVHSKLRLSSPLYKGR